MCLARCCILCCCILRRAQLSPVDPTRTSCSEVESTVDSIVNGLFSAVVTLGSVPILRYKVRLGVGGWDGCGQLGGRCICVHGHTARRRAPGLRHAICVVGASSHILNKCTSSAVLVRDVRTPVLGSRRTAGHHRWLQNNWDGACTTSSRHTRPSSRMGNRVSRCWCPARLPACCAVRALRVLPAACATMIDAPALYSLPATPCSGRCSWSWSGLRTCQ